MPDHRDKLIQERPLTANGRGANLYLPPDLVRSLVSPLTPGTDVVAQIVPHQCVVLFPESPSHPVDLTVRDPAQYISDLDTRPHG